MPEMTPVELSAKLKELHAKATPGEWRIAGYSGEHEETGAIIESSAPKRVAVTDAVRDRNWVEYEANPALIVLLRNAMPDLLAMMERLERAEGILARIRGRWDTGFPHGGMAWAMNRDASEYFAEVKR